MTESQIKVYYLLMDIWKRNICRPAFRALYLQVLIGRRITPLQKPTWTEAFWLWWYLCISLPALFVVYLPNTLGRVSTESRGQKVELSKDVLKSTRSEEELVLAAVCSFFVLCHEMAHSLKFRCGHIRSPIVNKSIANKVPILAHFGVESLLIRFIYCLLFRYLF